MPRRGVGPTGRTTRTGAVTSTRRGTIGAEGRITRQSLIPPAAPAPPVHHSFWHNITHPGLAEIAAVVAPITLPSYLAAHSGVPGLTQAGRAAQALLTSPHQVIAHPKAAAENLGTMAVGLVESPYAIGKSIKQRGVSGTAAGLWLGIRQDYQRRYGANWQAEARKNPLFNLADLLVIAGPATKVASVASSARELGRVAETAQALGERGILVKGGRSTRWADLTAREKLRIARAESRQPGLYTKGKAKTRQISAKLSEEGKPLTIEQPLSETPLRRGIQQAFDNISRTYPGLPGVGAASRTARATARQFSRASDRVLASIPGAENLAKIGKEGRARAFWEANVVPHTLDKAGNIVHNHDVVTAKLKELHAALSREYADPAWKLKLANDDPALADALDAARQRGFGKPLLKELEQAIRFKPTKQYEGAINAMKHASTVGEQVIRDTEGFSTLPNDLKRLNDRLDVLGDNPAHAEEVARIHEQIALTRERLATKSAQIEAMLTDRRRALPEYLASAPVDAPERRAWEQHMVDKLGWTPGQASDALRLGDLRARAVHPDDPARYWAEQIGSPTGESAPEVMQRFGDVRYQDFPTAGYSYLIEGEAHAPAGTSAYYSKAQKQISDEWGNKPMRQAGQVAAQLKGHISKDEWRNAGLDVFFDQFDKNEMISQSQVQTHLATTLNKYNIHETHTVSGEARPFGTTYNDPFRYGESLVSRAPGSGEYHEIVFQLPPGSEARYTGTGFEHWQAPNVTGHIRFQVFEEGGVKKLVVEEIQSDWNRDWKKGLIRAEESRPPLSAKRHNELAVDRVLRHAGENGVDEVIFPEAHVQHVRNAVGDEPTWEGDEFVPMGQPVEGQRTVDVRAAMDTTVGESPFTRLYEEELPGHAAERLGVKGAVSEDAYKGHFSVGAERSQVGPIKGTVFKLDDALRAKATERPGGSAAWWRPIPSGRQPRRAAGCARA
jgi:hypothetical protein